jgi:hypothetical protein
MQQNKKNMNTNITLGHLDFSHLEMAIRMAIGNTRANGWKNIGGRYKEPLDPLYLELTPAEQAVVRAWVAILSAEPEPLACDGYDISRRGTGGITALGGAAPHVPAVVAGFLSYVSREMSWELPAKLHAILYPEPEPVKWFDEDDRERIQEERAERKANWNELYYGYLLRSAEPYSGKGEVCWGYRISGDGHLETHVYGRENLHRMRRLHAGWEVVKVKLAHNCEGFHKLKSPSCLP